MTPAHPEQWTTLQWFNALYADTTGWLTIFAVDRSTGDRIVRWAQTPAELVAQRRDLLTRCCVWHGAATRRENLGARRGGDADCLEVSALWVDIDVAGPNHAAANLPPTIEDAWKLVTDLPLPPSCVINTGGGIQGWWLLQEPLEAEVAAPLLTAWGHTWATLAQRRGWHIDNVFDLARVMRAPYTYNRKVDPPQQVTIEELDSDRRYGVDDIEQFLLEPPAAPTAPRVDRIPYIGADRPGDAFNQRHDGGDVLARLGWPLGRTDRNGDRHYVAPHHAGEHNPTPGATVYADGHTTIWSETVAAATNILVRRPYDPFGLYVGLVHRGDWKAATAQLRREGYGTPVDLGDLIGEFGAAPTCQEPAKPNSDEEAAFWQSRPELAHIHQAALAALVSPWALLGVTLARIIAAIPPDVTLPPIIGSKASLNIAIGLVGPSGSGKGIATSVAEQTIQIGLLEHAAVHTVGSGQGIAHAYAHWDQKLGMVSRDGHPTAVVFIVEEVDHLLGHSQQTGSTMLAELRRVLMGERLGHLYADRSRRIELPAHSYRAALIVGIQPARAGVLLNDADGGTPQRFLWLPTTYPHPDTQPAAPTPLNWTSPPLIHGGQHVRIPDLATAEIRQSRLERSRGHGDPLDGHRLLVREKAAAALALLAGRITVTDDDWALSAVLMGVSDATRAGTLTALSERAQEANVARGRADATRNLTAEDEVDARRTRQAAQAVMRRLASADWVAHHLVRKALPGRLRREGDPYFDDALSHLFAAGAIEQRRNEKGDGDEYRAMSV